MDNECSRAIVLFVLSAQHARVMGLPRKQAHRYIAPARYDELLELDIDPDVILDEVYENVPLPV